MTDETKTIEKLTKAAKASLLEAITEAVAQPYSSPEALEFLARAYASVASNGPSRGELNDA